MKLLAFAATNSSNSINRSLVEHAATYFKSNICPEAHIETLDLNNYEMPIYSIDREKKEGIPEPAQAFFDRISSVDAIIVSFAEHNGFVTAAWKNIFDWMSRVGMKVWQSKPMVMLSASPGERAGANVLASQEIIAPHFGADLRGKLGIGKWSEAWDSENQRLARTEDIAALANVLNELKLSNPQA